MTGPPRRLSRRTLPAVLYLKLILMAVFWSGVFPAVSIVLRSMEVNTAVFLRFVAASAILLALLRWKEGGFPRLGLKTALHVATLGLLGVTLYNLLFNAALVHVEASRAALIVPTNPAVTALFAALFLGERLGVRRALGVALSVAGALWVLARGEPAALATLELGRGEFYLILCVLTWSAYTLLGRVALASISPLALTAYLTLCGALPMALPAAMEAGALARVTAEGWVAMAYLVVFGTVLPLLWFYEGIRALGAMRAAQFINLVPPCAVASSIMLLGESMTGALWVGAGMVVAGLVLTNRRGARRESGPPQTGSPAASLARRSD